MGYSFTFQFSEGELDFSPRVGYFFNYDKFLINEFFSCNRQEFAVIMAGYRRSFGQSAYDYVMKNYCYGWRNGDRTLSNVQESRILFLMPEFLNETAKQKLEKIKGEAKYRVGIEEITNVIKRSVQTFFSTQSTLYSQWTIESEDNVTSLFQEEFERVKSIKVITSAHPKVVVLTEEEQNEALSIGKYIIYVKLEKQFSQIANDFNTFLPFMQGFKRGVFKAFYTIPTLNIKTEITKAKLTEIALPNYGLKEIEANSRFKSTADKYLAYELANIHSETNRAIKDAFLNANDLEMFFSHYEELSNSDNEINMKSTFIGEGGILNIEARMKPMKMLKTSIAKSTAKILIFTVIIVALIMWASTSARKLLGLILFGGIPLSIFYATFMMEEISSIKLYKSEIKLYGK